MSLQIEMMKRILSGVFILLVGVLCYSQVTSQTDLSGNWKLKNSSKNTSTGGGVVRELGGNLVITQSENEIGFVGKSVVDGNEVVNSLTYFTDGRGEENRWIDRENPRKTVTKWEKSRLIIIEKRKVTFRGAIYGVKEETLEIREEWSISKDGKKLTQRLKDNWFEIDPMITSIRGRPAYSNEVKRVYERQP